MKLDRNTNLRNFKPDSNAGSNRVISDGVATSASKDSLIGGKNTLVEHTTTYKGDRDSKNGENKRK